jgi:hypothetical protein
MTNKVEPKHNTGGAGCFPEGHVFPDGVLPPPAREGVLPSGWNAIQEHNRLVAEQEEYQRNVKSRGDIVRVVR